MGLWLLQSWTWFLMIKEGFRNFWCFCDGLRCLVLNFGLLLLFDYSYSFYLEEIKE